MSEVQTSDTEKFTVSGKFIDALLAKEFERGAIEGMNRVTHLDISDGYEKRSSLFILRAKTRRQLSQEVRDRNSRRSGDNPGQAYLWTCELLRAYRCSDGTWQGVCVASTHYDV